MFGYGLQTNAHDEMLDLVNKELGCYGEWEAFTDDEIRFIYRGKSEEVDSTLKKVREALKIGSNAGSFFSSSISTIESPGSYVACYHFDKKTIYRSAVIQAALKQPNGISKCTIS